MKLTIEVCKIHIDIIILKFLLSIKTMAYWGNILNFIIEIDFFLMDS